MFKDYVMWFNHVIRIQNTSLLSTEHLQSFHHACTITLASILSYLYCLQTGMLSRNFFLLERSLPPRDAFNLGELSEDPYVDDETMQVRGLQRRRIAALTSDEDGHRWVHL